MDRHLSDIDFFPEPVAGSSLVRIYSALDNLFTDLGTNIDYRGFIQRNGSPVSFNDKTTLIVNRECDVVVSVPDRSSLASIPRIHEVAEQISKAVVEIVAPALKKEKWRYFALQNIAMSKVGDKISAKFVYGGSHG